MTRPRGQRDAAVTELDDLLSRIDFDDLADDEVTALNVILRPIVDRVTVQEKRPPVELGLWVRDRGNRPQ